MLRLNLCHSEIRSRSVHITSETIMNNRKQLSKRSLKDIPYSTGPFRAVIVKLTENTNFIRFQETLTSMTFTHPNFYRSFNDKHKCVIYYKHPYDVATVIEKYNNNEDFCVSLFEDEISKNLSPNTLYLSCGMKADLAKIIKHLNGIVIRQGKMSMQVQFPDFKTTTIAQEELGRDVKAKFAYKSEIPTTEPILKETKKLVNLDNISEDISILIEKYPGNISALKNNLSTAMEKLKLKELEINRSKISKAAENLDLANVSWEDQITLEETIEECQKGTQSVEGVSRLKQLIQTIIDKKKC